MDTGKNHVINGLKQTGLLSLSRLSFQKASTFLVGSKDDPKETYRIAILPCLNEVENFGCTVGC